MSVQFALALTARPAWPLGPDQVPVLREEYHLLQATLRTALAANPAVGDCLLVAEYELSAEAGRRPDVVLGTPIGHLIVLEFQKKAKARAADYDQVNGYVRDLARLALREPRPQGAVWC